MIIINLADLTELAHRYVPLSSCNEIEVYNESTSIFMLVFPGFLLVVLIDSNSRMPSVAAPLVFMQVVLQILVVITRFLISH